MGKSVLTLGVYVVVLLGISATASSKAADFQPDPAKLQSWFALEWKNAAARRLPDLDDLKLTWRIEEYWAPPADEISRIRAELKGHPDHPDRSIVPIWESRRAGKPTVGVREVWMHGTDEWRLNMSNRDQPEAYEDEVVRRDQMWAMNQNFLGIMSHEIPDPTHDITAHHRIIMNELHILLSGGMIYAAQEGVKCPAAASTSDDQWAATYSTPEIGTVRIEGDWDASSERGIVRHIVIEGGKSKSSTPMELFAKDWKPLGYSDAWIAQRIEVVRLAPRQLDRVTVFEEVRAQEEGEFDRITRLPEYNGADAIRGKVTFTAIEDLRADVRQLRVQTPTGEEIRPLPPIRDPKKEPSLLRTTGWVTLGCVVTAFLFLVIRRKTLGR